MMFTIARLVFHSHAMESAIADMIRYFLPTGQEFVTKNMEIVAHARSGVQLASVVMLLISSTGVFLPLEVALNRVWGVTRNRSYFMNQLVSLGLAAGIGTIALLSVAVTAAQRSVLQFLFFGHINNVVFVFVSHWLLQISAAVASVLLFFLIYWILPNRKLPVRAVLPTAIVVGLFWELAKMLYIGALPWMDLHSVYGPFSVSVSLMLWAFVTGLLLLAGAHYSASRHTLHLAHLADPPARARRAGGPNAGDRTRSRQPEPQPSGRPRNRWRAVRGEQRRPPVRGQRGELCAGHRRGRPLARRRAGIQPCCSRARH